MRRKFLTISLAAFVAGAFPVHAEEPADITAAVAQDYDTHLKELFLHFHQNPELSFREYKTSARLAEELRAKREEAMKTLLSESLRIYAISLAVRCQLTGVSLQPA